MNICDPFAGTDADWTLKSIPPALEGVGLEDFAGKKVGLFDDALFYPAAILRESVLRTNSAWMRNFIARTGVRIAPHGKTTMTPDLFRLQMADGAWAITAATAAHVRAYRRFGVDRIFMANQLVGDSAIDWLLAELDGDPNFDFYSLADSVEVVSKLQERAARAGLDRPLQLLVEVGAMGGRTGVRNIEQGVKVAEAIAAASHLSLVGVECFEGIFQGRPDGTALVESLLEEVIDLARTCDVAGLFDGRIILTAGGSSYFDRAARMLAQGQWTTEPEIVIRSGCYLTHDSDFYQRMFDELARREPELAAVGGGLRPALQVWAHVQSHPEPGRIICGLGRRDIGNDLAPPKPIAWARKGDAAPRPMPPGHAVTALNDQHAYVDVPADTPLRVGDLVGFGMSHPCTTFDKWRALLLVDDAWKVTGLARTYF
ncbi:type III PLP-dependent enzyme domain-containing protein [Sphingosinicella rhizophila]|uniref:Amino acid deaminase n=1 Tax=Sphingosinicella rhizophila TaxID=3050082 RepID=A0ABU3QBE9_9SPHN|nr:amino acid deaminase [Sphingosinicella sp. GR2756]MDT9600725.1 amino acid deaminase [Sphingosinicella sp. GR2756]